MKHVVLSYPKAGGPDHFVLLVKCNGKCSGIDQGWLGGNDHVFDPEAVLNAWDTTVHPLITKLELRVAVDDFCGKEQ